MLCLLDIVHDYDEMERQILKSDKDINELFLDFDGYNWEHTEKYTRFDFEHDDYVFTIIQFVGSKPRLAKDFSIYVGVDLIDFERW